MPEFNASEFNASEFNSQQTNDQPQSQTPSLIGPYSAVWSTGIGGGTL